MKRQIIASLMCAVMILAMLPVTALAQTTDVAQVGEIKYTTMSEAASAWASNGGTLKLLDNVSYGTKINLESYTDFVLDLNGFTYNAGSGNSPIDVYSELVIKDSSKDKTGKITCDFGSNKWVFVVFVEDSAKLTVESGTIVGKNGASNDKSGCIYGVSGATINISGGEIIDQTTGANKNR